MKTLEEKIEELCRNDNHISGDSGKSNKYAIKKSSLKKALITAEKRERERIEKEIGGFHPGCYALKFNENSEEAKHWNVWIAGYDQCRKDALNACKPEAIVNITKE